MSARRGEVWFANFDPVRGHEQGRKRPALVVSDDQFNAGPSGLLVVVPLTTKERQRMPLRVRIDPPEGGLAETSFAICEGVRSISSDRLLDNSALGPVSDRTMSAVGIRLRTVLNL